MNRLALDARWELLQELIKSSALPDQPQTLFAAMDKAFQQICGHKLFTLMILHHDTGEAERVYTSNADAYPVSGRKHMVDTPWFKQVIVGKQHYLGSTDADIRWAFADHELIKKLGCSSIINLLVVYNDRVLGTVNLLHEAHYYRQQDIPDGLPFAQLLATPYSVLSAFNQRR